MKGLFIAALAALIFIFPAITEAAPILGAIFGAGCLGTMAIAGGKTDVKD